MSTLIVALILIGLIAAVCIILLRVEKSRKRKQLNWQLYQFSRAASMHKLILSSQEILHHSIIGLDGIRRKLLVLEHRNSLNGTSFVIDFSEVRKCTLQKYYMSYSVDSLEGRKPERFLDQIVLSFDFDDKPPVEIVFYKHLENPDWELLEMQNKAQHWETLITKMLALLKKSA